MMGLGERAMNTVFSVDDLTDSFWPPPAPAPHVGMTRSQSECAFQKLLEEMSVPAGRFISSSSATDNAIRRSHSQIQAEPSVSRPEESASEIADVVEIQKPQNDRRNHAPSFPVEIDPNHHQEILKRKLHLACAAVALRQVATVKPEDSSASSGNQKQPQGPVMAQMSPALSSVSAAPSLGTQNKPGIQVRQVTSGSSRDDSDDEDLDGDAETTENADPADIKRAKRMLSNRESARRSRRRKQEQMNELDTQVGQLRTEHSTLLKRLRDMNHKYETAAVDNRILKADIETLRTKVKMAEETVKRVTGMNHLPLARPNSIPFNTTPTDSSRANLKPANPNITGMIPNQRLENDFASVPLNVSPVSNSTKVPLPQNVALSNHLPEQVNPFAPTSCNAYETMPHWNLAERKNSHEDEMS